MTLPDTSPLPRSRRLRQRALGLVAGAAALLGLGGCAVVSVAGAAAGAAIAVTGAVVSAGVQVTGKVVEKTIDAVSGSKDLAAEEAKKAGR